MLALSKGTHPIEPLTPLPLRPSAGRGARESLPPAGTAGRSGRWRHVERAARSCRRRRPRRTSGSPMQRRPRRGLGPAPPFDGEMVLVSTMRPFDVSIRPVMPWKQPSARHTGRRSWREPGGRSRRSASRAADRHAVFGAVFRAGDVPQARSRPGCTAGNLDHRASPSRSTAPADGLAAQPARSWRMCGVQRFAGRIDQVRSRRRERRGG